MNRLVITLLTWLAWLSAQITAPHPNAGRPADPAQATRPRRYVGRHAANRKRDNA